MPAEPTTDKQHTGETMRALICRQWGGIDDLTVGDAPVPAPGIGELLIRIKATAVNFADSIMVAGRSGSAYAAEIGATIPIAPDANPR